jgi:acetate CoA/acetoacetate CoA-transferase beta subunit
MDRSDKRRIIAKRIAQELTDGDYVNLGIGIPTLIPDYISKDKTIFIESENGILGVGPSPEPHEKRQDLINAGGEPITMKPGAALFDSFLSFSMIRGGHVDVAVLGALEADSHGNIANWMIPGKRTPGMGGAMDLVSGAKEVIVAMEHTDRNGKSKILKTCTLPLTGANVVRTIVTEMAFIKVTDKGLELQEIADWTTLDDVIKATDADLILPEILDTFSL